MSAPESNRLQEYQAVRDVHGPNATVSRAIMSAGLLQPVAERSISRLAFRGHAREHGNGPIDVIVDDHLMLALMVTVKPTDILRKRALPRDRHRKEQGIESRIIKTFAQIAPGSENEAFLAI